MKVSKEEVIKIKPGKTEVFICDSPLAARNGQALILNYVKKYFLPKGVSNYTTTVKENVLTVTAVASIS
jgi:hypothetical protein